jgi:hypothetical protein
MHHIMPPFWTSKPPQFYLAPQGFRPSFAVTKVPFIAYARTTFFSPMCGFYELMSDVEEWKAFDPDTLTAPIQRLADWVRDAPSFFLKTFPDFCADVRELQALSAAGGLQGLRSRAAIYRIAAEPAAADGKLAGEGDKLHVYGRLADDPHEPYHLTYNDYLRSWYTPMQMEILLLRSRIYATDEEDAKRQMHARELLGKIYVYDLRCQMWDSRRRYPAHLKSRQQHPDWRFEITPEVVQLLTELMGSNVLRPLIDAVQDD